MTANLLYPRKSREVGKFSPVCVLYCINRPSQRLQRYSPCSCHGLGRPYGALTTDVGVRGLGVLRCRRRSSGASLCILQPAQDLACARLYGHFDGRLRRCLFVITSHDQNQLRTRLARLGSKIQPTLDQQTVDGLETVAAYLWAPFASANSVLDARRPRAPRPSLPSLQQCRPPRRRVGSARIRMPSRRHRPLHPSWSRRRSLLHPLWRRRRRDPLPSLRNQNLPQPSKPPGRYRNIRWLGLSASRTCKSRRVAPRDS